MRQHSRLLHTFGISALVGIALAGCAREPEHAPYIARVGKAVLTRQELSAVRDSLWRNPRTLHEYINEWIANELLCQEAARRGFTDSEELKARIEAIRRRLAIDALLQEILYASDSTSVTDDAISALYASGGSAFLLKEDVVNVSFALFSDRDAANAFRSRILRGSSWQDATRAIQQDSLLRPQLLQFATRQYFTQTNLYPQELWKLARTLSKDEVSFVVKTEAGYYVLMVHSVKRQGEMPELDYVKGDIRDRLLIEERRRAYDQLLASLREKADVEVQTALLDSTETITE